MDNLTHSMAGWSLGQAGLKTQTRKGLAALILGANMPDIDIFFGNAPWDPLAIHRGFTHGLCGGVLVMPPILAALLWLLDRWQIERGTVFKSGLEMRFGRLLALSCIGTLTHPLLDMLTTYSVQLYSPFSKLWYHCDGLFIIDVWIWLLLALAIGISMQREKKGKEWRRIPQIGIALLLLYIGGNLLITARANAAVRDWAGDRQVEALFASPPPVEFWKRGLVWREDGCYRRATYDLLSGFGPVSECESTNLDDPIVRQAIRSDKSLRKFLKWSILPQADVIRDHCTARVTIGDARYGEGRRSRLARETIVPIAGAGCSQSLDNSRSNS